MRESVTYKDIVQTATQKEALKRISLLLSQRFGQIDSSLMEKINRLSAEKLEALAASFLSFSEITDLANWLEQNK